MSAMHRLASPWPLLPGILRPRPSVGCRAMLTGSYSPAPTSSDPLLFWAADTLGAHFILAEGIVHVRQPESAIAAARAALPKDPWSIAALHVVTTLTGSALLALALLHGVVDQDQAWTAAHVDEDWNSEKWGVDEEVAARRAARLVDFRAAARILKALNP